MVELKGTPGAHGRRVGLGRTPWRGTSEGAGRQAMESTGLNANRCARLLGGGCRLRNGGREAGGERTPCHLYLAEHRRRNRSGREQLDAVAPRVLRVEPPDADHASSRPPAHRHRANAQRARRAHPQPHAAPDAPCAPARNRPRRRHATAAHRSETRLHRAHAATRASQPPSSRAGSVEPPRLRLATSRSRNLHMIETTTLIAQSYKVPRANATLREVRRNTEVQGP